MFFPVAVCFGLLMSELALFSTIVCPMPFSLRKKLFHFLSENPVIAKLQYGLKITFIFVAVLFVDALQRMVRIAQEGAAAKSKQEMADVRTETNYAARRFYAQRNLYLTGATLFLSLILSRVFYIILDFIHVQENYTTLQAKVAKQSGASGESEELRKRIKELEVQLESNNAQQRDFDTLKKQASQQNAEYNRLADEHNKTTGAVSDKKAD
ncbi:putative endoplasmic reticulum protein [Papiliotrema laurentii]|uniref:Endoplasmic reticulum transmembrane protein n=1 Tax=Papiliotrema laurentii TaxID=5418 RepID=A0AAD9FTJ3_PAPLA|nr:putative endoplasmic reticulum protein [Papiliotrema laurentii]